MNKQLDVLVDRDLLNRSIKIALAEYRGDKMLVAKPMSKLEFVYQEEGAPLEPMLELPSWLALRIAEEIIKQFHAHQMPNESKLQGKLEAIERHLEDMRKLVFKN